MSKPDDIPQDVWDSTEGVRISFVNPDPDEVREAVARAVMEERERCAKIAEEMLKFADTTSASDIAISQAIRNGRMT